MYLYSLKCKLNCISRRSKQAVVMWQAPARPQVESYRSKEPINQSINQSMATIVLPTGNKLEKNNNEMWWHIDQKAIEKPS